VLDFNFKDYPNGLEVNGTSLKT